MSLFTSGFWDVFIAVVTVVSIVACAVFLKSQSKRKLPGAAPTTGHVWDEDLAEYNNPLPRWWSWLFYITVVFSLVYLVLYPGLGSWQGTLGWSQLGQLEREQAAAAKQSDGTHLVQLGSFASEQGARRAWGIYVKRYPELSGHEMVISEAVVRGKRYWRVSAGGFGRQTSTSMCGRVRASGQGCFAYAEGRPLPSRLTLTETRVSLIVDDAGPGVIENGLFVGLADEVIIADGNGTRSIERAAGKA